MKLNPLEIVRDAWIVWVLYWFVAAFGLKKMRKREPALQRLGFLFLMILAVAGGVGYEVYPRTLGRPPEVQTAIVSVKAAGQASTLLTGATSRGGEPGDDGQDECEHGGDITAGRDESLDFSTLSEFLVGTAMMRRYFEVRMQSC